MSDQPLDENRLMRLREQGRCLYCEEPLTVREPREGVTSGSHNYCLLQQSAGHVVEACWCNPETKNLSMREIAVLAYARFNERFGEDSPVT